MAAKGKKGSGSRLYSIRMSSAASGGADKDSERRAAQRHHRLRDSPIPACLVLIRSRCVPASLRCSIGSGPTSVRTVLVEDASRFARELVTQELDIIARSSAAIASMVSRVSVSNGGMGSTRVKHCKIT